MKESVLSLAPWGNGVCRVVAGLLKRPKTKQVGKLGEVGKLGGAAVSCFSGGSPSQLSHAHGRSQSTVQSHETLWLDVS